MQANYGICAEKSLFWPKTLAFLPFCVLLLGCEADSDDDVVAPVAEVAEEPVTLDCGAHGFVSTELFGALAGKIDWDETDLICEGMPRPDGDGARLRLAGSVDDYEIAFIIALPDLVPGAIGKELPSKVTVIEEGAGRFFSNADQDICWTDIEDMHPLNDAKTRFQATGSLYCVAPLIEINGDSDITLGDFAFRGLLDWEAS